MVGGGSLWREWYLGTEGRHRQWERRERDELRCGNLSPKIHMCIIMSAVQSIQRGFLSAPAPSPIPVCGEIRQT